MFNALVLVQFVQTEILYNNNCNISYLQRDLGRYIIHLVNRNGAFLQLKTCISTEMLLWVKVVLQMVPVKQKFMRSPS